MGTLWRSQPMQLIQLLVQRDSARDTMEELGNLGIIQFKDLNANVNSFQRVFVNEVKRCEELERKLRFVTEQIAHEKTALRETTAAPLDEYRPAAPPERFATLEDLESYLTGTEREMRDMNANQDSINKRYYDLIEMQHVLQKDNAFFGEGASDSPLLDEVGAVVKLGFVTGVIRKDEFAMFERIVWRSLRGNAIMKHAEIEEKIYDVATGVYVTKVAFIAFYQGQQADLRIKKICDSFGARTYACPDSAQQRGDLLEEIKMRIAEMATVRHKSEEHRRQLLAQLDQSLSTWVFLVRKEKAIYHAMNMFNYDVGRKCLIAEGWCPTTATEDVLNALNRATASSGSTVPSIMAVVRTREQPPTYFSTNKFTSSMQGIIEAYGTARYGEVNPTVFSIVTFPFLFAIMFGDAGHAAMMMAACVTMILFEKKLEKMRQNEIFDMLFGGRYVLLLMSFFSVFTGLIYNDIFGLGVNLCGTTWHYDARSGAFEKDPNRIYEFGIDSAWKGADNELYFYNSFKMKLSVIVGVIQMVVGVIMSLLNHIHFRQPLNIIFEFIPEMIFLCGLFGYLVVLIFVKWIFPLDNEPYLINVVIDVFLAFPNVPPADQMYSGQQLVQNLLAIACVLSIFVMLIPKPVILWLQHRRKMAQRVVVASDEEEADEQQRQAAEEEEDEFEFSEVFIHQSIHTIEFVLGCVSNTASYLRLWALSLAHAGA
eukprot:TRINITY_DN1421_c0_g1_i3.p1 TRINITY_DN1421_c0_g1~~TRINITY_DN1421_c0_g1_i3.p1  ORF type:complete len:740 (+),score=228.44 TRINITY_DN1421_c0_g1_i3:93-2222(+)